MDIGAGSQITFFSITGQQWQNLGKNGEEHVDSCVQTLRMTRNQKRPCLPEAADAEPVVSGLELAAPRVPVLGVLPRQALANQR